MGFLPGGSEWLIILLVIIILFGAKKIPELIAWTWQRNSRIQECGQFK